jgi:predicted naringenin-chalcone synthase
MQQMLDMIFLSTVLPGRSIDPAGSIEQLVPRSHGRLDRTTVTKVVHGSGIERRHLAALDFEVDRGEHGERFRHVMYQPGGPGMSHRAEAFDISAATLIRRALDPVPCETLRHVRTLITVSCTQAAAPGLEGPVLDAFGELRCADRWHIGMMGCSAGLAALRLAGRLGPTAMPALILCCELCSFHIQDTEDLGQLIANALFADGVAAVMLDAYTPEGPARKATLIDTQCITRREAAGQMTWTPAEHGFRLTLSPELPSTLAVDLRADVASFLARTGRRMDDVRHWIIHPGGPRILDAAQAALGLSDEATAHSRAILQRLGNMSSTTVFFILEELRRASSSGPTVAIAFGPGLTTELALLDLNVN